MSRKGKAIMEPARLLSLRKFLVPEIVYGEDALELAGRHAVNFGAAKALIVTDPGVRGAGWASRVEESLKSSGISYAIFSDVTPNPKDYEVMKGADIYREEECDLILAVGGGSSMDCAKGIGVMAGNSGSIIDFEGIDEVPNPGPPLIFIPTTAGSSADVSQFAIITDTKRMVKIAIVSKMVVPDIALVDPKTTTTMLPALTAETGMDALCHAFEAYVSTASSPLTDMAALSSVRLVRENLEGAFKNPSDMKFRGNMMMASLMAGLAFSNASLGLVHAMAHSLGGCLGLPHGECNAILLEHVVDFNFSSATEKYTRLAEAMGIDVRNSQPEKVRAALRCAISDLRKELEINGELRKKGVSLPDIPRLAENTLRDPCLVTNPRTADKEDIVKIFRKIE